MFLRNKFVPFIVFSIISVGVYAQVTDDQEAPEGEGSSGYQCKVKTICYNSDKLSTGEISCKGVVQCYKGDTWVACDGKITDC